MSLVNYLPPSRSADPALGQLEVPPDPELLQAFGPEPELLDAFEVTRQEDLELLALLAPDEAELEAAEIAAAAAEEHFKRVGKRPCTWCFEDFAPNSGKQIYCSTNCRVKAWPDRTGYGRKPGA